MYITEAPNLTVADLLDSMAPEGRRFTVPTRSIQVRVNGQSDDTILIGDGSYPYTGSGALVLGDWLDIPSKFLERLDPDLLTTVVNTLASRKDDDVSVSVGDTGLLDATVPNDRRIDPREVVNIAARVMGPEAQVLGWRKDHSSYSFEAISHDLLGGEVAVGDISHGGLRFGQQTKSNLAPWVQPYLYRLVCTNGMEIPDPTLAISSRGSTLEDVLESLEGYANVAYARLDHDIREFYDLKNDRVERPEQELVRIAREQALGEPTIARLVETFAQYQAEDGSATRFDLINAITNQANDPVLAQKFNSVRKLQRAGGQVAFEHPARCVACRSRLGN